MKGSAYYSAVFRLIERYYLSDNFSLSGDDVAASVQDMDLSSTDLIEFLFSENAVLEDSRRLFLNFDCNLISSTKKTYDVFKLSELPKESVASIRQIVDAIKQDLKSNLKNITLVGSQARNLASSGSDYDFLIISRRKLEYRRYEVERSVDILQYTPAQFKKSLSKDDEFALWALKYGLTLYDNDYIEQCYPKKLVSFEELKKRKKQLLERLIYRTHLAFGSDRVSIISKRLKKLNSQVLRSAIIARGGIPRSAREIEAQFFEGVDVLFEIDQFEFDDSNWNSLEDLESAFECIKSFYNEYLQWEL